MEVDFPFIKSLFREIAYALQAEASVNTLTLYAPINVYQVLTMAWPKPGTRMGDSSSRSGFVGRWQESAINQHVGPGLGVTPLMPVEGVYDRPGAFVQCQTVKYYQLLNLLGNLS